jgi:hypothetical protein
MRTRRERSIFVCRTALAISFSLTVAFQSIVADNKPTGAPLVLSPIETEQEVPLVFLAPDGKTAKCATIRLHWNSQPNMGPKDDATSFTLDLPADNPAAPIFSAQLWNASLASALAWQEPWEGARWKVLQTPVTDGTGMDAALAVGMIATSARRPYPPKTVVIGSLNPDGSLGPVSHLVDRLNAAAAAGMTRAIIPSVQRFDTDPSGQVVNVVRHAGDLHVECIPVDNLVAATETTMNDPLPDSTLNSSVPKYSDDVANYIDDFAHHEQNEAASGLKFAPKEADLATYPTRLQAIWKSIYADNEAGEQAYRAGQVYTAYRLFCRVNGRMAGANALAGQTRITFDVKEALAESDDLHDHLHILMNPPSIDNGGLESAVLVAEMADWAYDINASIEGAQLVTKQTFSQRSDATDAEKDRAREAILFSNEQCKYLLTQANFYTGLLAHISSDTPLTVDENAAHLLPQLIPAQLATARSFVDGIRASELRDGLLFDPRLVAYVNVLRQSKADWDAHQHKKEIDAQVEASATAVQSAPTTNAPAAGNAPVKLNANSSDSAVGFDPGDTYRPPHTVVAAAPNAKKLSDVALCLIWVNNDCEIATLDEKYLRLTGTMDPTTHEWKVKDRAKLDALLQMAELGARHGIAFAEKTEINPSVLAMIYERAAHQRIQNDDATALDALRNYWRCALLGNMCWQLAHTPKAQPVEAAAPPPATPVKTDTATTDTGDKTKKPDDHSSAPASTNVVVKVTPSGTQTSTNVVVTPIKPPAPTNAAPITPPAVSEDDIPVAHIATNEVAVPTPPPAPTNSMVAVVPPAAPAAAHDEKTPVPPAPSPSAIVPVDPPVAPIAKTVDDIPAPPVAPSVTAPSAPPSAINPAPNPVPGPSPVATASDDANVPVAPVAKMDDYAGSAPATNAVPVAPKASEVDSHAGGFP